VQTSGDPEEKTSSWSSRVPRFSVLVLRRRWLARSVSLVDFTPNRLNVQTGDYVHFQWTGSNTNPRNNAGNGLDGTDRSNLVIMRPIKYDDGQMPRHCGQRATRVNFASREVEPVGDSLDPSSFKQVERDHMLSTNCRDRNNRTQCRSSESARRQVECAQHICTARSQRSRRVAAVVTDLVKRDLLR
jgi:hypothetical protein